MKKITTFIITLFTILSFNAGAAYNANMIGVLKSVMVYTEGSYIYLILDNQPKSHPTCKPNYFVISDSVPQERRQMLLSRLLSAYAMKEKVNIGYDSQGDCVNGYIRVHRVG